jgi:hypothetical protein
MRYIPDIKEPRVSLQQARRHHALYWRRYKFIHAKYIPVRFKSWIPRKGYLTGNI